MLNKIYPSKQEPEAEQLQPLARMKLDPKAQRSNLLHDHKLRKGLRKMLPTRIQWTRRAPKVHPAA